MPFVCPIRDMVEPTVLKLVRDFCREVLDTKQQPLGCKIKNNAILGT
jgi:hypothetical protein